jgi:hypothetical protein
VYKTPLTPLYRRRQYIYRKSPISTIKTDKMIPDKP